MTGLVSNIGLKKCLAKNCPQWSKGLAKRILTKALDAGVVEQVRGKYRVCLLYTSDAADE